MNGCTIMVSMGREYGGFHFFRGFTTRLCLGWIAFTFIPMDDCFLGALTEHPRPQPPPEGERDG